MKYKNGELMSLAANKLSALQERHSIQAPSKPLTQHIVKLKREIERRIKEEGGTLGH